MLIQIKQFFRLHKIQNDNGKRSSSAFGFNTSAYDDTKPECDCGYGVPGQNSFNKCYGNSFYLGIYGAIGVSVGIMSFTKGSVVFQLKLCIREVGL